MQNIFRIVCLFAAVFFEPSQEYRVGWARRVHLEARVGRFHWTQLGLPEDVAFDYAKKDMHRNRSVDSIHFTRVSCRITPILGFLEGPRQNFLGCVPVERIEQPRFTQYKKDQAEKKKADPEIETEEDCLQSIDEEFDKLYELEEPKKLVRVGPMPANAGDCTETEGATIGSRSLSLTGSSIWVGYLFRLRSTGQTSGSTLACSHSRADSDGSIRIADSANFLPKPKISFSWFRSHEKQKYFVY